jgi:hypothetical protein
LETTNLNLTLKEDTKSIFLDYLDWSHATILVEADPKRLEARQVTWSLRDVESRFAPAVQALIDPNGDI